MKKNTSQLKTGIILNYINMGLGNLIPVFYTPIMLSLLGKSEYGLYKLSSSVTSYLSLMSMGLGAAITRYLIKAQQEKGQEEEENVLGLFMVIFRFIAVASLAVGLVLTLNLHIWYAGSLTASELQKMRILVFIMVCNTALSFSVAPYMSVVNAHEKFLFLQCMNIGTTCVMPIANMVMLYLGYASIGMAMSSLVINILIRILYLYYVRSSMHIRARYDNIPTNLLKEIIVFSFWIFVSNLVSQLYNSTDTVMIGAVPALAATGVAIYNVGGTFNNVVFSLTTGISNLLAPKTNKMVFAGASNEELTNLAIKVGRIQGYIFSLVVSGFIAFGRPFIHFYAGDDFAEAYWVAVFMMVPNMIPLVQSVCLSVLIAQNRHRFRAIVYLGIAILNVAGTWFLMHTSLGVVGAALMTGIALVVGQGFVMNWYYHNRTGLDMVRFWNELVKVYIVPTIMCVITLYLSKILDFYNIPVMMAGIVIYTVVFCIVNYLFIMNDFEKSLVLTPIKQMVKKFIKCNLGLLLI